MSSTSTMMAAPVLARSGRFTASVSMLAMFVMALVVSQASNPELVSRLALRADVAQSIARAVQSLGSVPWWALLIIGGGVAGVLVRLVIRYRWRYAAAW